MAFSSVQNCIVSFRKRYTILHARIAVFFLFPSQSDYLLLNEEI